MSRRQTYNLNVLIVERNWRRIWKPNFPWLYLCPVRGFRRLQHQESNMATMNQKNNISNQRSYSNISHTICSVAEKITAIQCRELRIPKWPIQTLSGAPNCFTYFLLLILSRQPNVEWANYTQLNRIKSFGQSEGVQGRRRGTGGMRESCEWRASARSSDRATEAKGRAGPIRLSIGAASARPWRRSRGTVRRSKP